MRWVGRGIGANLAGKLCTSNRYSLRQRRPPCVAGRPLQSQRPRASETLVPGPVVAALFSAEEYQRDADTDQENAKPASARDAFAEKYLAAQCASCIAQGRDRNDEADVFHGERAEQGKEGDGHKCDAEPHPGNLNGAQQDAQQRAGAEVVNFTDRFHGAGNAELTRGAGEDDQNQQHSFPRHYSCSVVRGEVWPTISTPRQMTHTPAQRVGEIGSFRMKCACRATTAYAMEPAG